jgi:truncated hemoglobin YjbI
MASELSLYDLLSGDRREMHAVTRAFYEKVLADELLSPYFADVDIDLQAVMLAEFLARAFGGPDSYTGRDLRSAHAKLAGLDDAHFDRVVGYLAATLREFGVSDGDIATAGAVAETVRDDVLNR